MQTARPSMAQTTTEMAVPSLLVLCAEYTHLSGSDQLWLRKGDFPSVGPCHS